MNVRQPVDDRDCHDGKYDIFRKLEIKQNNYKKIDGITSILNVVLLLREFLLDNKW